MTDLPPLMPHQREAINFAKSRHKSIWAHGMRLGKTRSALTYLDEMVAIPALVVCPASLRWVWKEQCELWTPHLKMQVLETGKDNFKRGADIHVVSYEYITQTKAFPLSKLRAVIVDEAHYLKTIEAARTQRLWAIVEHLTLAVLMSGTLVPNRPVELYAPLRMIGAVRMDWYNYARRYCAGHNTDWGFDATGASNLDELSTTLQPHMHYRTKEMVSDSLPIRDRQVIALNLPVDQREKEFDKQDLKRAESAIALEGLTDLMVFIGEVKAPGTIEFVKDLLTRVDKVIIFFQYHTTADILEIGLEQYGLVRYDGNTSEKKRRANVRHFQEDPEVRVFLGQIKAAGVGIPLWAADTTVFAEASWVPGDLDQAEARVDNIQKPQPAMHYYMTIHGSIDEHQLRRTLEKTEVIQQIMDPAAAIL